MHDGNESTENPGVMVRKRRKGIYILPNLFTLAALFGGFYSIVMAMNGRFDQAAVGVFCAMVLDSLDGRVARMTNTQSTFGEQMDSLSDMVCFGAAPKDTMSDSESICSPNALCVLVMRATRPSRLSSTMAQKTPTAA